MNKCNTIFLLLPLLIFLQYGCSKDNDINNQIPEIEGKILFQSSAEKGINVFQKGEGFVLVISCLDKLDDGHNFCFQA